MTVNGIRHSPIGAIEPISGIKRATSTTRRALLLPSELLPPANVSMFRLLRRLKALQQPLLCGMSIRPMSARVLGCVKTASKGVGPEARNRACLRP
jgi:hypothetical protein